jgi:hypothetical protein
MKRLKRMLKVAIKKRDIPSNILAYGHLIKSNNNAFKYQEFSTPVSHNIGDIYLHIMYEKGKGLERFCCKSYKSSPVKVTTLIITSNILLIMSTNMMKKSFSTLSLWVIV